MRPENIKFSLWKFKKCDKYIWLDWMKMSIKYCFLDVYVTGLDENVENIMFKHYINLSK